MWLQDSTVIFGSFIIDYQKNPNFSTISATPGPILIKIAPLFCSSIYLSDETAPEQFFFSDIGLFSRKVWCQNRWTQLSPVS
jgi:hypothetical protein